MNTKIILETGCNHQGDINIAYDLIDQALKLNVWGIKFQKRDIEQIPNNVKSKKRELYNSFGETYYLHRKALEFDKYQMSKLKQYSEHKGLVFICSAFDITSIYDLIEIGCKYIKLPSQLYSDVQLQKELIFCKKKFGCNIIVSTGMHNAEEILNNDWLEYANIIMHCISIYPCDIKEMNLYFIHALKNLLFKNNGFVGYSSHDREGKGIPYAVMAGATYIERHFTFDKKAKGSDHSTVSSDYKEMLEIIKNIKNVEEILGNPDRECNDAEKNIRRIYRGF